VFARERSERAANLRDYVTVVAASVNRGGKLEYVLVVYVWSTLDAQNAPASALADSLLLIADDRRIRLNANGKTPAELASRAPCTHRRAGRQTAGVSGRPRHPALHRGRPQPRRADHAGRGLVSYELWDDERPALDRYVRFLKGER